MLAITYSNIVWAANCNEVNAKVLEAMAKTFDVHADDIDLDKTFYDQGFDTDVYGIILVVVDVEEAIEVELKDEDVVEIILTLGNLALTTLALVTEVLVPEDKA